MSWQLGNHTATASSDSPACAYQVYIEVEWYNALGERIDGAPDDLLSDFAVTARSDWSEANCTYSGEGADLVCSYVNLGSAPNSDGLWVPSGTMYVVEQNGLPEGWLTFTGVGMFPGSSSSRSFYHIVDNRATGG